MEVIKMFLSILVAVAVVTVTHGSITLESASYTRFPDETGSYTIDSQTVRDMAFDEVKRYLYIVGRETGMYHVVNLRDHAKPVVFTSQLFDVARTGRPLDIALCRSFGRQPILAVSFDGVDSVSFAGKLGFYHLMESSTEVKLRDFYTSESAFLVGAHPDNIKFTKDCSKLIVACEGVPRTVGDVFNDPEGAIHVIGIPSSNASLPSDQTIEFSAYNNDNDFISSLINKGYRYWMTTDPMDATKLISFAQNIEPEHVAISPNGANAYVTLQENNAIVAVDLRFGIIRDIYPMGTKDWNLLSIDASDQDSGIKCEHANIKSFYQPDKCMFFEWLGVPYLLTLDEGQTVDIIGPTGFKDHAMAMSMTWFTGDQTLNAQLADAARLGSLQVSTTDGFPTQPYAFGGRGFSIFNTQTMSRVWESGDQLERHSRRYYKDTFNGDCSNFAQSPVDQMDENSPLYGPQPSAVAMGSFNGKETLVIGGGKNGLLYVYAMQPTVASPQPEFQSVHRSGTVADTWNNLYASSQMGDAVITDIEFSQTGTKMVMVLSQTSGSLSVYTLKEECWPPV